MSNLLCFSGIPAIDAAACDVAACMIRLGYPIWESRSGDARDSCVVRVPSRSVWFRVVNLENSDVVVSLCPESGKPLFESYVNGDDISETSLSKFMRQFCECLEAAENPRSFRTAAAPAPTPAPTKAAATKAPVLNGCAGPALSASETGQHSRLFSEELCQGKLLKNRPFEAGPLSTTFFPESAKSTPESLQEWQAARDAAYLQAEKEIARKAKQ